MKRFKQLALVVFAALALTGLTGVASASASGFEAEQYPATVSLGDTEGQILKFQSFTTLCAPFTTTGTELGAPSETLTTTFSDASCSFWAVKLNWNGCKLIFHPQHEGIGVGTLEIGPAGCGPITLGSNFCQITIGPQTGIDAWYKNEGSGSGSTVKISASGAGFDYTQVSGTKCEHKSFSNGQWTGEWTAEASSGGSQTGLRVVQKLHKPIAMIGGEGSGKVPQLAAASYPVSLDGEQTEAFYLKTGIGSLQCATTLFSGTLSSGTNQPTLDAQYWGCALAGITAKVAMNGCRYVLNVDGALSAPPYFGNGEITCPEGKEMTLTSKVGELTKCTVTIPDQMTYGDGVTFENKAWGAVQVGVKLLGIKHHTQAGSGFGVCATGDHTNGTYTGAMELVGYP